MSYESDDPATRLAAVREAISRTLTSQHYTLRGRSQRMAELRDLRALEKDLQREVAMSGGQVSLGMQVPPK